MRPSLATYLHDHLARADFAVEVLQAMAQHHGDRALGQFASAMLAEVEEDRAVLRDLADLVGAGSSVLKEAAAWLGEKAARVKIDGAASDDFGTFEALESVALGILGKASLWRALQAASAGDPRLNAFDFERLHGRAQAQHARAEEQRLTFAVAALAP